jgi:proteasome lid subunit RPN8/RPN11
MLENLLQPSDTVERCGLILKDGTILELVNVHDTPERGYRMDPTAALPHLENLTGTWHTHPDSDPNLSEEDYAGFLAWPDLEHYIIGRRNGQLAVSKYIVEEGMVIECD